MEAEDFSVYEWEWWHFDHEDWREYPILNRVFEELEGSRPGAASHPVATMAPASVDE